jgi:hypothetical protein
MSTNCLVIRTYTNLQNVVLVCELEDGVSVVTLLLHYLPFVSGLIIQNIPRHAGCPALIRFGEVITSDFSDTSRFQYMKSAYVIMSLIVCSSTHNCANNLMDSVHCLRYIAYMQQL